VRIEFVPRSDDPAQPQGDEPVASAAWVDGAVQIDADDPSVRAAIERVFRAAPVGTDDHSYRRFGTDGRAVLQPGTFGWFRAAAFERAPTEGFVARVVPGVEPGAGWDPAAQYLPFSTSVERFERIDDDV
jgi:hypothetical protein